MNLAEGPDTQKETESESAPLNTLNINSHRKHKNSRKFIINNENNENKKINYCLFIFFAIFFIMFVISVFQLINNINYNNEHSVNKKISNLKQLRNNNKNISTANVIKNINHIESKYDNNTNYNINKNIEKTQNNEKAVEIKTKQNNLVKNKIDEKIGVAFVYHILHSNGVARVISITSDYLIKTGKYNVYLITGNPNQKDYKYDNRIKRFSCHENRTLIKLLAQRLNIKFFILNNQLTESLIKFYQSLNANVIGIFHGVYLSAVFHNNTNAYRSWHKFNLYNSFITVTADDLYFYKKLGYKNGIFIPNLYTFELSETPESNLTYNNIVMLGRAHDKVKGTIYAIKAMSYIVKEVPDAKLIIATSDPKLDFLQNLTKLYNITNSVSFKIFPNITEIFLNSSVLIFTSLCEAFPMAMNEGKAHGLPAVAFDIPFSPPFQSGVITVPHLHVRALAIETIKLLKDYNYRKIKGKESKLSLNRFSNQETVKLWEKLFYSLANGEYNQFQKEIEDKYYNEDLAREHLMMHYNNGLRYNKYFRCHKFENMLDMNYIRNIKNCTNIERIL